MKIQIIYFLRLIRISIKQIGFVFKKEQNKRTYIFHHLPRCGGTSLRSSLSASKRVFNDYRLGWGKVYPFKYPLARFDENDCLSGHFELEGCHLFQRYPKIFDNRRFILFTFIRDPLDLIISYYYYRLKMEKNVDKDIRNHLFMHKNYLAKVLNVTFQNYKTILDRYDFIGIFEEYDESLLRLSTLLGNKNLIKKNINKAKKNELLNSITPEDIIKFKKQNELDFTIYKYCLERFNNKKRLI